MPSSANVTAPITLVAAGRSGTTLLTEVFRKHPQVSVVGETGNLIFELWNVMEEIVGVVVPLVEEERRVDPAELAVRVVRQTFLTCFPSSSARWMHKPLGVPKAVTERFPTCDRWDDAAIFYWNALDRLFPNAAVITILRHPCDVVLSSCAYWGYPQADAWWSLAFLCHILSHPRAPIRHALSYENLTRDPSGEVQRLFTAVDLPFDAEVLAAFAQIHSPTQGREQIVSTATSRRREWERIEPRAATHAQIESIRRAFEHFGVPCELPASLIRENAQGFAVAEGSAASRSAPHVTDLERRLTQLTQQIERLHVDFANKDAQREILSAEVRAASEAKIAELQRAMEQALADAARWRRRGEALRVAGHDLCAALGDLRRDLERWRARSIIG